MFIANRLCGCPASFLYCYFNLAYSHSYIAGGWNCFYASTIGYVWVGLLLFFGIMITHDYQLVKNILTVIGTIVGMAFIMFLAILFSTLIGKIVGFVSNIITEVSFRM